MRNKETEQVGELEGVEGEKGTREKQGITKASFSIVSVDTRICWTYESKIQRRGEVT